MEKNPRWELPNIHVETDMAFAAMDAKGSSPAVAWKPDPLYDTQVNVLLKTPCLLECSPPLGPDQLIGAGETFESFRVFELLHDSPTASARGSRCARMYRTIAPWVTENPLIFHAASAKADYVRGAIDQASEAGFDLVLMTFGSGFDIENTSPQYMEVYRRLSDYAAREKGRAGRVFAAGQPLGVGGGRRGEPQDRQARRLRSVRQLALPGIRMGRSRISRNCGHSTSRRGSACSRTTAPTPAMPAPPPPTPATGGTRIRNGTSGGRSPASTSGAGPGASTSTCRTGTT